LTHTYKLTVRPAPEPGKGNAAMQTALVERSTVNQLVENYNEALKDITEAYKLLHGAKARLNSAFSLGVQYYSFDVLPQGYSRGATLTADSLEMVIKALKLQAWRIIMERLELRKLLSIARRKELDEQLKDGEGLPDITIQNVWGLFESAVSNVDKYMEEAVLEVFEFLRPRMSKMKTNTEFEIGKRVVLERFVEMTYNAQGFRPKYSYSAQLTALDNAFLRLDGQGVVDTYHGDTINAIQAADAGGWCKTAYFQLRCCKNGNLHIEFLRPDLVAKLNTIAGGARLKK
jgi:hypothetical protein